MEIKITNFLGVASVSIPLTTVPVAVIGHNACGKTSIATAIAAILSRNYNPLSIGPTKRPYMRDDADNGEVTLVGEGGSIFRQWVLLEKGIRVLPGGPEDISKHVLGLIDFIAAPAKYRVEAWETCFLPEPKTLVEMVGNELREQLSRTAAVDEVLAMLRAKKWEECEAVFSYKAREGKTEWAKITGEAYGAVKANRWNPAGWISDLDSRTPAEVRTQLEEAREALRIVQVGQAVRESDVARGQRASAELPNLEKEVADLKDVLDAAKAEHSTVAKVFEGIRDNGLKARNDLDRHDKAQPVREQTVPCPACGEPLVVGHNRTLSRARDEAAFNAHLQAWTKGRESIAATLDRLRVESRDYRVTRVEPAAKSFADTSAKMLDVQSRLSSARRESGLAGARVATDDDTRRISEGEQTVENAQVALELITRKVAAQNAHLNVVNYSAIAYALGPKGIRSRAMKEKLDELDAALHQIEEVTHWPRVKLDTSYGVTINGRAGVVSAASERWRAQFVLQCGIAMVLGERYVIADGADILYADARVQFIGLCEWLASNRIYPIVCATGAIGELPEQWRIVTVADGVTVQ